MIALTAVQRHGIISRMNDLDADGGIGPQAADGPTTNRPRRRRLLIACLSALTLVVVGVIAVAVYLHSNKGTATFTVTGTMTISGLSGTGIQTGIAGSCKGTGGYSDLAPGAEVVISDSTGRTLAIGQVGSTKSSKSDDLHCTLPFEVEQVPLGKGFYGVQVGHRNAVQFTEAQLKAGAASLTIGS